MATSVILIQGGIRDIMQTGEPLWEIKLIELITPILGGGLLGGCIALILDRIRKPDWLRRDRNKMDIQVGRHVYRNTDGTIEIDGA